MTIPVSNGPQILAQNVTFKLEFSLKVTHPLKIADRFFTASVNKYSELVVRTIKWIIWDV